MLKRVSVLCAMIAVCSKVDFQCWTHRCFTQVSHLHYCYNWNAKDDSFLLCLQGDLNKTQAKASKFAHSAPTIGRKDWITCSLANIIGHFLVKKSARAGALWSFLNSRRKIPDSEEVIHKETEVETDMNNTMTSGLCQVLTDPHVINCMIVSSK